MQYRITSGSIRLPTGAVQGEGDTVELDAESVLRVRAMGVQLSPAKTDESATLVTATAEPAADADA